MASVRMTIPIASPAPEVWAAPDDPGTAVGELMRLGAGAIQRTLEGVRA
jgi:hypothetical protein